MRSAEAPVAVKALRDRLNRCSRDEYPRALELPANTYDAVEHYMLAEQERSRAAWIEAGRPDDWTEPLAIMFSGPNNGLMFKNVELIRVP